MELCAASRESDPPHKFKAAASSILEPLKSLSCGCLLSTLFTLIRMGCQVGGAGRLFMCVLRSLSWNRSSICISIQTEERIQRKLSEVSVAL